MAHIRGGDGLVVAVSEPHANQHQVGWEESFFLRQGEAKG